MSRLIFVPQYPSKLRYQEFFYTEFPKQLSNYFDEVIILGLHYIDFTIKNFRSDNDEGLFSSRYLSINLECEQINEYLELKIKPDDILLLMDISYPGFFSNVLYHKPIKNSYCYCHATSKNNLDIFENVRYSKFPCETAHSKLFNKVFIGSDYHDSKLIEWSNTEIVGLPIPPFKTFKGNKKEYEIISVARPNSQKINKELEDKVEKEFGLIIRKDCGSWEEYYEFLSKSKILLITTKEETFGYSCLEAIMNGTIVIAPNHFSYPELLPSEFLYNNYDDLSLKIWSALHGDLKAPEKLLCNDLCENFYENIAKIMKEEK